MFQPFFEGFLDSLVPVHIIGSGVYGEDCSDESVYSKRFSQDTLSFYKRIAQNGGIIGCRDILSYQIMKANGIPNVQMTGCPAMFDMRYFDESKSRFSGTINRVIISDPGVTKKAEEQEIRADQAIEVIEMVRRKFSDSEIVFTFNNGINTKYSRVCNNRIKDHLERVKIKYKDLSGTDRGFSIYDEADLHIGFRVHSHIYSLSERIPSILIEEDLRGYGINETLGLPHVLSYDMGAIHGNNVYVPNEHLCRHIENLIDYNLESYFGLYSGTYMKMRELYSGGFLMWADSVKKMMAAK